MKLEPQTEFIYNSERKIYSEHGLAIDTQQKKKRSSFPLPQTEKAKSDNRIENESES